MYKKINMCIIAFFIVLSIKFNVGFSLYIPILLYYLIRDIKNIYYFTTLGLISLVVFTKFTYLIPFSILMVVILFILWIMNKLNKGVYIYGFVVLLDIMTWFITYKSINNVWQFVISIFISILLYLYLERNYIESIKKKSIFFNSVYVEILIAFLSFASSANIVIKDFNIGFVVAIYFAMYFSTSYKNIYAMLYGVMSMIAGIFYFSIKETIFIPFVCAIYYLPFIYPLMIINVFSVAVLLAQTTYNDYYLLGLMGLSVFFEICKSFIVKTHMSDDIIRDNIYTKVVDKASDEVLSFAAFLDKFAESFKTPSEYNEKLSDAMKVIVQTHCVKCNKQTECFNKYRSNIYIYFRNLLLRGEDQSNDFKEFMRFCIKSKEIDYTTRKLCEQIDFKIVSRNNNALIGQITGVAGALRKYAIDMVSKNEISDKQVIDFKNRLIAYGYDVTYFEVSKNFENDFIIEIGIKDNKYDKIKEPIKYIGDSIFQSRISTSFNKELNRSTYIKVFPEIKLDVLYGFGTISSEGNNICGDNYLIKELNNGKFISAISDGMGKGYSAFCESNMTLNLVEDVIKLNLDSTTALEILNSFYAIQDYLERYATLDLIEINRYTSLARFYKMGGTTSFVVKPTGEMESIQNKNLPFGIDEQLESFDYELHDGDLILMSSDGIFENVESSEELLALIKSIRHYAPQKIAYEIINYAINAKLKAKDDMTLIVLKVKAA